MKTPSLFQKIVNSLYKKITTLVDLKRQNTRLARRLNLALKRVDSTTSINARAVEMCDAYFAWYAMPSYENSMELDSAIYAYSHARKEHLEACLAVNLHVLTPLQRTR